MTRIQRQAFHLLAFAAAIIAAGAGALVRADARGGAPLVLAQTAPTGVAADALRPAERTFIVQAVETARDQAELSRLAVGQASSSSLRDLAQQLVGDYREINNSLETLARSKAITVPLQPTSFGDRYRELASHSGQDFDRAFVRELVAANQRVLRLCESAVANARDADVRALAGSLLPTIRDHVNKSTQLEQQL